MTTTNDSCILQFYSIIKLYISEKKKFNIRYEKYSTVKSITFVNGIKNIPRTKSA